MEIEKLILIIAGNIIIIVIWGLCLYKLWKDDNTINI